MILWPTVWAHSCELGQVEQVVKRNALEDLMFHSHKLFKLALPAEVHQLAKSNQSAKTCHHALLIEAVIRRVQAKKPSPSSHTSFEAETPPPIKGSQALNASAIVISLAKGKTRRVRAAKAKVVCPRRGLQLRRDNIARQQGSAHCKQRVGGMSLP